jgi:transcriptional regulator with XRE-family HTH domain
MAQNIGHRVKDMRTRRGLSQNELVERMARKGDPYTHVGRQNLSRVEAGTHLPSLRTRVSIARGLNLMVGTLLVGVDDHLK